ncbi:MAG: response regulator transcription factor [Ignavibacteriae bacterium]|nr:response regulator transcription factor [Ignavibacteriota bacterium]
MKDTYKILIVDDHQIIIDGYKTSIKSLENDLNNVRFNIYQAKDCYEAIDKLNVHKDNLDLIFLDICLPNPSNGKFSSGEDLGITIRNNIPKVKLIVSTSLVDNLRLTNIMQSLNPEAFLIKSDIGSSDIVLSIKKLLDGGTYYSKTILNLLRKKMVSPFVLDDTDIQILKEVSNAASMKELADIIPLSRATIEKRKRLLKAHFNIKNNSDRDLVLAARKRGFI